MALSVLFVIQLAILSTASGGAVSNYWGSDNRVIPAGGYSSGRFYSQGHVYEPEYYYPDEEHSNQIGRHPVNGAPTVYPLTGRHHEVAHWRHRVAAQHPGRVTVPKRNNNYNHFHDGSRIITANQNAKYNKSPIPAPPRKTTGLFRSSQWGSATIPYKGAKVNVPVLSGNKKVTSYLRRGPRNTIRTLN